MQPGDAGRAQRARCRAGGGPAGALQAITARTYSRSVSSKREVRRVPSRTLMLRAFQIEAALPHLAWCRAGCSKTMCTQMLATKTDRPHLAAFISCHRSVGGLRLASPAQFFAKLRSDKSQAKRSGSSFRADSLQPLCRLFGGPHVRHVRQMDRSQDAGAASAVPVVC